MLDLVRESRGMNLCPPCNFRRNHSNCSVIELCRTQSEAKHLREKLIKFDFRTQSNQLDLIERFKPTLKIDKDWGCSKQKGTIRTSSEGIRDCSLFMPKGGVGGVGDFQVIQAYEKFTPPRKWVF